MRRDEKVEVKINKDELKTREKVEKLNELEKEYEKNKMMLMRAIKDEERFEEEYKLQSLKAIQWEEKVKVASDEIFCNEGMKRKEEYNILAEKYKEEIYKQSEIIQVLKVKLNEILNKIEEIKGENKFNIL